MALKFLDKDEVEYLSFEGGGGKGNAYLGAIQAFENLNILKYKEGVLDSNIKGISGSSAGAITALMIGAGYTFKEIKEIFVKQDFNDFFDYPSLGKEIKAGSFVSRNISKDVYIQRESADILKQQLKQKISNSLPESPKAAYAIYFLLMTLLAGTPTSLITPAIKGYIKKRIVDGDPQKKEPGNKVLGERIFADEGRFENYLKNLYIDFGLFSGEIIHRFFNKLIVKKIHLINPVLRNNPRKGVTNWLVNFKEFKEYFKIDIKFTSVNLRTGNLHILSETTTPNLPVATAARMSMSLPFIFKPVIIEDSFPVFKDKKNDFWNGLWIDGGLFDNAPVRIFESDKSLLIRLGPRELNANVDNFLSYIQTYFQLTAGGGSGSGQITQTNYPGFFTNIIELDVSELSLLQFNPEQKTLDKLIVENRKRVLNYFNLI